MWDEALHLASHQFYRSPLEEKDAPVPKIVSKIQKY